MPRSGVSFEGGENVRTKYVVVINGQLCESTKSTELYTFQWLALWCVNDIPTKLLFFKITCFCPIPIFLTHQYNIA